MPSTKIEILPDSGGYTAFRCSCGQSLSGASIEGILHLCGEPHNLSQDEAKEVWNRQKRKEVLSR